MLVKRLTYAKETMEEIDLKELFEIFWKKKILIIFVTIVFAGIGAYYTYEYTVPKYKSSTTLLLAQNYSEKSGQETNEITQTDITLNQKLVSTYSVLVKSSNVLTQVLQNLNMDYSLEEEVKKNITVKAIEDTQVIEITYINEDPQIAYRVANEIAKVFCDKVTEFYHINNVYIVDKAQIEIEPYNINHMKNIAMFAVVGMGISCVGIFIRRLLDTTIKTSEDVERNTGLSVLGQIPEIKLGGNKKE